MNTPAALETLFPPSRNLLLDLSRAQIDDGMLQEIAEADYGIDADAHLAALRPIRDQGAVPEEMAWHPHEVLALIRWSNPEEPRHKPGAMGQRGHQMRLFACAVLLRSALGEGREPTEPTLAQCLVSAKELGGEMSTAVGRAQPGTA